MSHTFFDEVSEIGISVRNRRSLYANGGKRVLDVFVVLFVCPIILPVILTTWLITYLNGRHGFYGQIRIGRSGKTFKCWKIRTMAVGSEKILADFLLLNPDAAAEWDKTQKLENDPRITRFGQVLRVTSIDEFPQFWNILKGEMSLIGPRPFTANQKHLYDAVSERKSYYQMRPGLSGLWQITSRNDGEFGDRAGFDEEYASNMSFAYDLKIAVRTVAVVLKATGK